MIGTVMIKILDIFTLHILNSWIPHIQYILIYQVWSLDSAT